MLDLIALARKADLYFEPLGDEYCVAVDLPHGTMGSIEIHFDQLQALADLIKKEAFRDGYEKGVAGFMEAVKMEREECINLCTAIQCSDLIGAHPEYMAGKEMAVSQCVAAIRERTTT